MAAKNLERKRSWIALTRQKGRGYQISTTCIASIRTGSGFRVKSRKFEP